MRRRPVGLALPPVSVAAGVFSDGFSDVQSTHYQTSLQVVARDRPSDHPKPDHPTGNQVVSFSRPVPMTAPGPKNGRFLHSDHLRKGVRMRSVRLLLGVAPSAGFSTGAIRHLQVRTSNEEPRGRALVGAPNHGDELR
jgi:hypothetical protein